MEQTTLYFQQGSSDKIYQANIQPEGNEYHVLFAFGRRGSTLQTGCKTSAPVPYDEARRIYDALVAEKCAKGYTRGKEGTPYAGTSLVNRASGISCQLLNAVEEDEAERLIIDPAFWMQEKFDGRRLLLRKIGDTVTAFNRLGLEVAAPQSMVEDGQRCPIDFIFDGEVMGDELHVFDVLRIGSDDITALCYADRYLRLMNLLASFQHRSIQLVHTVFLHQQKAALLHQLKTSGAEGVVFKRADAPYSPGRPAHGGTQLKYKFCATASFVVGKINTRRSVGLLLFDGDKIKAAGNVTIPANREIPVIGQTIEVRYLYAFRESGSVFQPVYLGTRDDVRAEECVVNQLKYRREDPVEQVA